MVGIRRIIVFLVVSLVSAGLGIVPAEAATGELTQKPGTAGCVSEDGTGGACQDGTALQNAASTAVSPDGKSVYVVAVGSDAVAVFDRAPDGSLMQKIGTAGCISETGTGGACQDGRGLDGVFSVAVSPDGTSVYVASTDSDAVAVFDRAADGSLIQKMGTAGCISETGTGGACQDGTALNGAASVAVSPDGTSVYVASAVSGAVAVFDRAANGSLIQKMGTAGCTSEDGTGGACQNGTALISARSVAVSPDGTSVYVVSDGSSAVVVFDRAGDGSLTQKAGTAGCISEDGTGGACQNGTALNRARSVAVSPDGASVYVASSPVNAVAIFDRAADGSLTQKMGTAGCISEDGTGGACQDGKALNAAFSVAVSPDGTSVYAASQISNAVAVFDRAGDGSLTQKAGTAGCISEDGTGGACQDGTALSSAISVAVSPDGASVYVASLNSHAVAIFDREVSVPAPPPGGGGGAGGGGGGGSATPSPTPSPTPTPSASAQPPGPGDGSISGDTTTSGSGFGFFCTFLPLLLPNCGPTSLSGVTVTATGVEVGTDVSAASDSPDYTIGGLAPGTYSVSAVRTTQPSFLSLLFGGGSRTVNCTSQDQVSRTVTVAAGQTTDLDWTCPESGGLFGFLGEFDPPDLFGSIG